MYKIVLLFFSSWLINCQSNSIKEKNYTNVIKKMKAFADENKYNQKIGFFIDYSLHSGLPRFFVADLIEEKILHKGLVCHGDCKGENSYAKATKFSNVNNSHCTSLGFALIGKRAYSKWGKNYKYWLNGLEPTNDKMKERVVVLHAWKGVPDKSIYPLPIATSFGCPTVSITFLDLLDKILKKNEKVILYSFK